MKGGDNMRDWVSEIALIVLVIVAIVAIGFNIVKPKTKDMGNDANSTFGTLNTVMDAAW